MKDRIKNFTGPAIIDKSGVYSYQDLIKRVNYYESELDGSIKKGENIVIYSDYNFFSISLFVTLSDLNINIIPLVKTTESEDKKKIKESQPDKILELDEKGVLNITFLSYNNKIYDFKSAISHNQTGVILFSSGTTGKPKVMIQNLTTIINSFKIVKRQKTLNFLIFLMFDHIGGLNTLLNCLNMGTIITIPEDRNPSTIISLISKNNVQVLPTSPTFLNLLLMDENFSPSMLSSLRMITYGTERMPENLLIKINNLLPRVKLLQTFGTSETGILKTESKSSNSLFFKIVDNDLEYKIVDNELYIKSNSNIGGYLNHSNLSFKKDGWFATGDIVEQDSDGYLKIVGRKNKIINVGGLKVMPSEIEELINLLPDVIDTQVYSEPNAITGNIVVAKVFSKNKDTKELKKEIKRHCRDNLEKFKIPARIIFGNLSLNNRGKKELK